jgi:predicted ATPase
MIKVNNIAVPTAEAYSPSGEFIGVLNEYEFNDLRVQIAKQKAEGYYMIYNNQKIIIDSNGKVKNWHVGFFDIIENQLVELFKLQ